MRSLKTVYSGVDNECYVNASNEPVSVGGALDKYSSDINLSQN